MNTNDPADRLEQLLRDAMHEEADVIMPAGDGLSKIQRRVQAGQGRQRFLRPLLALGSVVLLAAAGVGVYALTNSSDTDKVEVGVSPSPSESGSPSPSATTEPVAATDFPRHAIFPFSSAAAAQDWQEQYDANGTDAWKTDAEQVAQNWVQDYLGLSAIDTVVSTTLASGGDRADVTLGRTMTVEQTRTVEVTVVRMLKFGDAWIVVGASDPQGYLRISSPSAGDTVSSPVTVAGPGFGVDEAASIQVREATSNTLLGQDHASFGEGTDWSVDVSYSSSHEKVGALVVEEDSLADGGPQRLVVQQIRFAEGSATTVPAYFYGVKNGRITKFSSRDGAALEYLTEEQPGGGPSDPQLGPTSGLVYYLEGAGTCTNALVSVSTSGSHRTRSWASPDAGYVITGFGVRETDQDPQPAIAYYEKACDPSTSPQAKLVMRTSDGEQSTVKFKAEPPAIVGDPTWESDGVHVDAFIRTGNDGYLAQYDATQGGDTNPPAACNSKGAPDGMPAAVDAGAGDLWVAVQTGSSMTVATCDINGWTEKFSVDGNRQPADVDVSTDGAVLLTDVDGDAWRWDGSGDATKLSPSVPLDHVTW